jgi:hypothetical protein
MKQLKDIDDPAGVPIKMYLQVSNNVLATL